jgi:hypothetical protein
MARGGQVYIDWQARFAEPGSYDVTFTAAANGDTASANDVLARPVLVRPWNDIGVAGAIDFKNLLVGQSRTSTFTVTASKRELPTARFVAPNILPGLRVTDISASAGDCRVDADTGGSCDFTNLAPDVSVSVTVTWKAEESASVCNVSVGVSTAGDVSPVNDAVRARVETHGMTDLDLRVGAPVTGYRNTTVSFPEITIVNGKDKAFGTRLEVTLPAGVTLASVSAANAICSGTTVLNCDFADLEAGTVSTVNLSVHAVEVGAFTTALKLSASNAVDSANDRKDVPLQISNATNAAQTAGGAKGGGGRFEWLALACLALFVVRRCVVVVRAGRPTA